MAYLHGTFKNINNDTIEVRIISNNDYQNEYIIGDNYSSTIHFSDDPVTINVAVNDLFDTVIKKSCTISFMSSIFLGDILYAPQDNSITVEIYKNNVIIFDGYAEANTYNQPWAHKYDSYQLNCIDHLALLQNKFWNYGTQTDIFSFKTILQKMGFGSYNVFYDDSTKVSNNNGFEKLGVSLDVFLGDNEADTCSYEETLSHILRYMNLHIIQEGSDYYIFNWDSIKNNSISWINLFGSGTPKSASNITVTKVKYSDDSTNLSIDEVYNQVKVRADINSISEAVPDIFNEEDLEDIFQGNPEICLTEAWYDGSNHIDEFGAFIKSTMFTDANSIVVDASGNDWHAKDWFMKVQKNNKWNVYYHDQSVLDYITYSGTTPQYQSDILKAVYNNKFMPMFIKIGSGSEIKNGSLTRRSTVETNNYLVFSSCAGWSVAESKYGDRQYASKSDLLSAIDNARLYASGTNGLISYEGQSSATLSPKSDYDTNFIVIQGTIRLEPHHCKSGTGVVAPVIRSGENASFGDTLWYVNNISSQYWLGSTFACKNDGTIGYYQVVPWRAQTPLDTHSQDSTRAVCYLVPPVGNHGIGIDYYENRFTYNKSKTSDGWTDDDTINKIPIFECELKVGDKYCVEDMENLDVEGCPTFHWLTAEECIEQGFTSKSFTLGFDPTIGDFIMGKDYMFTNTADGRVQNKKGMAIPIKKSDALTGSISFKIKGVLNVDWNSYFDIEGSMSQTEVHGEGSYNLWQYSASIWLKELRVIFDTDNSNATNSNSSDILYVSDEQHNYINKKDDIDFKLCTQLTNEEAAQFGLDNAISYNNVINMNDSLGIENITEPNGTNRAEKLYVDQYYSYYSTPKVIVSTQLFDENYSMLNTFTYSGFGKTVVTSLSHNLHDGTVNINSRQI